MTEHIPSALVLLASGAEEMETVIVVDVLRRAAIDVTLASLNDIDSGTTVECSRGIQIKPDVTLSKVLDFHFDIIILPGGAGGAKALAASSVVHKLLHDQADAKRRIACVCAAPTVLIAAKLFADKTMTSHPGVEQEVAAFAKTYSNERVVEDGLLITSRGPGTCFEFALHIVALLKGKEVREKIESPLILPS
jgi:protein DJ-1